MLTPYRCEKMMIVGVLRKIVVFNIGRALVLVGRMGKCCCDHSAEYRKAFARKGLLRPN